MTKANVVNEEETKERIVQRARDEFFAHGFSKVTMDELCDELGISKKTMYEHFNSKDELLDAVTESAVGDHPRRAAQT